MSSVNKVFLLGNLGADPELKHLPSGDPVCELRLATNEAYTDKQGEKHERVEWHRVVVWGKMAEACGQYLAKGRQVFVEGKIQTRQWEDRDGNKRYMTEIRASAVQFLGGGQQDGGGRRAAGGQNTQRTSRPAAPQDSGPGSYDGPDDGSFPGGGPDDNIPF